MPFPSLDVTSPPWSDVLFRHALTFSNPTFLDVDWIHSISSTWGIRNREIESLSSLGPPQTIPYFPRAPLLDFKSHHQNSITTLYGSPRVHLNYIWIFLFFSLLPGNLPYPFGCWNSRLESHYGLPPSLEKEERLALTIIDIVSSSYYLERLCLLKTESLDLDKATGLGLVS